MAALFGTEQWNFDSAMAFRGTSRLPDGAWIGPRGPRKKGVSAVLAVERLSPWNVPSVDARLYHNPWAERPYLEELTQLPQAVVKDGEVAFLPGRSLAEVFDLPQDWPEN